MDWLGRYTDPDSGWTDWATVHRGDGRSVVTDRRCVLAVDDATAPFGELNLHPTRGAMNAISCQRDPITAVASATPTHVAIARVNGDARQRNTTSVRRTSSTPDSGVTAPARGPAAPAAA